MTSAVVIVPWCITVALAVVLCSPYLCRVVAAGLRAQAGALDAYWGTLARLWRVEMDTREGERA